MTLSSRSHVPRRAALQATRPQVSGRVIVPIELDVGGGWEFLVDVPDVDVDGCPAIVATVDSTHALLLGGATASNPDDAWLVDAAGAFVPVDPWPDATHPARLGVGFGGGDAFVMGNNGPTDWTMYRFSGTGWSAALSPPPVGLNNPSATVCDGIVYVMEPTATTNAAFYSYDPGTDLWDTLAPVPTSFGFGHETLVGDSVNSVVWYFGPDSHSYNPGTDTWTANAAADMPTPRCFCAYGVIGRSVYIACGDTQPSFSQPPALDIFDLDALTWTTGDDFPQGGTCAIGDTLDGALLMVESFDFPLQLWTFTP